MFSSIPQGSENWFSGHKDGLLGAAQLPGHRRFPVCVQSIETSRGGNEETKQRATNVTELAPSGVTRGIIHSPMKLMPGTHKCHAWECDDDSGDLVSALTELRSFC